MAADFLKQHGIDLDTELAKAQFGTALHKQPSGESKSSLPKSKSGSRATSPEQRRSSVDTGRPTAPPDRCIELLQDVSLPSTPSNTTWDVSLADGRVLAISRHNPETPDQLRSPRISRVVEGHGSILTPSLCHPHIHLDKAFLLSHPRYSHLQLERGDFKEAMELTGKAKAQFEEDDLLERGQRVLDESIAAGVTHMRAFVEVDAVVGTKCLAAAIALKRRSEAERRMKIQICVFAQMPLFSKSEGDDEGTVVRRLMEKAVELEDVECIGSTPYVESERRRMEENVEWMVDLSIKHGKHLDFHLDYHLDAKQEPMVWHVIRTLKEKQWHAQTHRERTIVLGHCTRLTLLQPSDWQRLRTEIGNLPVSFVGLPTSDLFIMQTGTPSPRRTLDVPKLIGDYELNACMGVNNIGNAFTPHGSCDPLSLACWGVGVYQAGTKQDAERLFECISTRAKAAIGFRRADEKGSGSEVAAEELKVGEDRKEDDASCREKERVDLEIREGDYADLLLFGCEKESWRTRTSVSEAVYMYDQGKDRRACLAAKVTSL